MFKHSRILVILSVAFLFLECSRDKGVFNSDNGEFIEYTSTNFQFYYTDIDKNNITEMVKYTEDNYDRICKDLNPEKLSIIKIWLYTKINELHSDLHWPDAPNWVLGSATSKNEIRMMSPNSPELAKSHTYNFMLSCIVHELAHCVCVHINPIFGNNPRWLWEGVALYESGQFVNPKYLSYITNGSYPKLKELDNILDTRIYDIGYTYIEYIINKWGKESVVALIKSNGNLSLALGLSDKEFETGWYEFVRNKYLE